VRVTCALCVRVVPNVVIDAATYMAAVRGDLLATQSSRDAELDLVRLLAVLSQVLEKNRKPFTPLRMFRH
jgi:hypothetical protein